jgi:two-component system, LuxR family, response regulator FixJ
LPLIDPSPTYRPFLNRHRVVYVLHADRDESEEIADAFTEQGYMTSSAASLDGLVRLIELRRPDVLIVDFTATRNEPELIATLRTLAFGVRVFLLAESNPDAVEVVKAVRSGAVSVFVKPFQYTEMTHMVAQELKQDVRPGDDPFASAQVQGKASLTEREIEVVHHVVAGKTNKEIAVALNISPRTVEVHRAAAMRKLGARNTADMVRMTLDW